MAINFKEGKDNAKDNLAKIVLERLRRAYDYKGSYIVHQNKTFQDLIERADRQYKRTYSPKEIVAFTRAFGCTPTRFFGLTQIKVNATRDWKRDLVVDGMDSMFTTMPTAKPDIDAESRKRINEQVQRELLNIMAENGVVDSSVMFDANGKLDFRAEEFLREQVKTLKSLERSRIQALAMSSADRAKIEMQDILMEGNFRQTYGVFTFDQVLYGMGFMRFPEYRKVNTIKRTGNKVKPALELRPMFRAPSVFDMYPTADGANLQESTAVIELTSITKADLINLIGVDGYDEDSIKDVLEEYEEKCRNWLGYEYADRDMYENTYWDPDEPITMLIHEGFLSGTDLSKIGITGLDLNEYANVSVTIVGGRTIRCEILKAPHGYERTYFAVPFNRFGTNLWDVLGMGAMLYDTEFRINTIMHMYENNMEWSSRPPILIDESAMDDEWDINDIVPGGHYKMKDTLAVGGGTGNPIRAMNVVGAQYQLLLSQIQQFLRIADEECGIPAFAYGAQDFGRSSLGEYSQRMSNALRTIKGAALEEDIWLIEPAFEGLFNRLMIENEDGIAEGQDIQMQVRGVTGLLQDDKEREANANLTSTVVGLAQNPVANVPPAVTEYVVRDFLEKAGVPVDALGMNDPQITRAVASAAASGGTMEAMINPQVPQLDGRSGGVPRGAVANPDGNTQY